MSPWVTYLRERSPLVPLLLMAAGVGLSGEALAGQRPHAGPAVASVVGLMVFFLLARLMEIGRAHV